VLLSSGARRADLSQVPSGQRPETLYHYTDSNGLLGIVTKKALRATDVQFLNDGEEPVYAAREISARLRSRAEELLPREGGEDYGVTSRH
jgi:hypothetical protein